MKIRFLDDIANRKRGQVADLDDETALSLITTGHAIEATGDTLTEVITPDGDLGDAARQARRK